MIGNLKGTKILQSIQRGIQVTMVIEVGKKHGPWVNHYSIFLVSVSFFIITAATVGYFIFYSARRLRNARAQNRKQVCNGLSNLKIFYCFNCNFSVMHFNTFHLLDNDRCMCFMNCVVFKICQLSSSQIFSFL